MKRHPILRLNQAIHGQGSPVAVDLYCGAGGMSLGFEQAGFRVAAAVDVDPIHCETYSRNFPGHHTLCADVTELSGEDLLRQAGLDGKRIDVLFGGPPCQGFSMIGRRRQNDPRNLLLDEFARLLIELKPTYFVVENVEGLVLGTAKRALDSFLERVRVQGYSVVSPIRVLDAKDYGVPQRRRRVFVLGYLSGYVAPEYPRATAGQNLWLLCPPPTVWDAIGDLPDIDDFAYLIDSDVYKGPLGAASEYAKQLRSGEPDLSGISYEPVTLTGCLRTKHSADTEHRFNATRPGTHERSYVQSVS